MRRLAYALAGTAVLASTIFIAAGQATAVDEPAGVEPGSEEHCVLEVVGQHKDGELITKPMVCAETRPAALERAGLGAAARGTDWAIGIHYEGATWSGDSVTVVGADCTGGWLNLPANWNNRISSTLNGCPVIRHFQNYNLTGASQTTLFPGGNMSASMDDRASSIQYLP